jgi:hypothetical protein
MKRKEAELADKLGFKLLCADHSTVDVEEYVQFLDRYHLPAPQDHLHMTPKPFGA